MYNIFDKKLGVMLASRGGYQSDENGVVGYLLFTAILPFRVSFVCPGS